MDVLEPGVDLIFYFCLKGLHYAVAGCIQREGDWVGSLTGLGLAFEPEA
jgi:hypothetical protein